MTAKSVQVHGAIGTTRDHDMGRYYRRAKVSELEYADSDFITGQTVMVDGGNHMF